MAEKRDFEGELTKAIGHGLDWHKIVVMAIAIAVASVAVYFFGWLGAKIGGKQWAQVFSFLVSSIGWLVGAVAVLCGMVAVCKMAAAKDGGQRISFIGGIAHAIGAALTVIFAGFRYFIWLSLGIAVMWGLGLLGGIGKGVGTTIWGVVGFIPIVVGLYLLFFIIAKFFLGTLILPGIIAEGGGKAIRYFRESKRIINGHTIRLVTRLLLIGLVIVIFVFLTVEAVNFVFAKTADTMGTNTLRGGRPMTVPPIIPAYDNLPIIGNAGNLGKVMGSGAKSFGAWWFGIEMLIITLIIQGMATTFYAVAGMYSYQALKGEPETAISGPDIKVPDISKLKGSLDAVGAKFREEMKEEGQGPKKTGPKSG